ncbi:MAG: hypothetical protein ABI193_04245 [Minicystis sp.]
MRYLALLLLVASSSLAACAPKTCEPGPLPEEFKEVGPLLPASTVVCGRDEGGKALLVNFRESDVKKLALETIAALTTAGWTIGKTSNADNGSIVATKGPKSSRLLQISINSHKGGPNVGRVTGRVSLGGAE